MFGRQAIPMVWDFGESNPLGDGFGSFAVALDNVADCLESLSSARLLQFLNTFAGVRGGSRCRNKRTPADIAGI